MNTKLVKYSNKIKANGRSPIDQPPEQTGHGVSNPISHENAKLKIQQLSKRLENHRVRNLDKNHINHKISHLLCDPFTFNNAYSKISKNAGALTKGIDKTEITMLFYKKQTAVNIPNSFKKGEYKWSPTRRTLIPKPGKKDAPNRHSYAER